MTATPKSPHIEAKFTALDMKPTTETGVFAGYASLFNREDLGHDIILPGAFRDTLSKRGASGVRMLFQHNPSEPIGVWEELREDERGLYARGRLTLDATRSREVHALMRAGAIDGLSIGFNVKRAERDRSSGIRRIGALDLWEISIVTFPMLPEARIGAVKSKPFAGTIPTPRDFERWLMHDAGLSRSEARALMAQGLKGWTRQRDAARLSDPAGRQRLLSSISKATALMAAPAHYQH
jgi:uncharacterized protein